MNSHHAKIQQEPDMGVFMHSSINKFFVYGTLKKTFLRSSVMDSCKFLGDDTLRAYLFTLGAFPCIVPDPSAPTVYGEVYEAPEGELKRMMDRLDGIENVPHLYYRLPFKLGSGRVAWAYWQPFSEIKENWELIYTGKWIGHNSPKMDFSRFMKENTGCIWPRKPKMKFDPESRCTVVVQGEDDMKLGHDYVSVSSRYSHSYPRQEVIVRPPEPQAPPIVPLDWLGKAEDKPQECKEYKVEGI